MDRKQQVIEHLQSIAVRAVVAQHALEAGDESAFEDALADIGNAFSKVESLSLGWRWPGA